MPSASADVDRERRRRPTADDRSRSREPGAGRSASRDASHDRSRSREPGAGRSASREPTHDRSRSREPPSSSSSAHQSRGDERERDRHRAASRDRPHRSPSREKPGTSAGASASSSSGRKRPHVRYAAPVDAAALAASGSKSGFLRKQADNEPGAWNRYFFVLKSSTLLYYYNSDADEAPRGVVDLEFLADVKRNGDCLQRAVGGGEHCFRLSGRLPPAVRDKMRPLFLDAESAEDARAWADALRGHRFSLAELERAAADAQELERTRRALAKLEAEQAQQASKARATSLLADRVLDRLRRLALSSEDVTEDDGPLGGGGGGGGEEEEDEGGKVDLAASLQAMESVVNELQLKLAAQQAAAGALREQVAELERKQRDKALKFVAATFKKKATATRETRSQTTAPLRSPGNPRPVLESESEDEDGALSMTGSSLTSALEDPEAAALGAAGRPKSASIFARGLAKATRSKTVAEPSPPGSRLGSCVEEEDVAAAEEPKGTGKLRIRLRGNTTLDKAPAAGKSGGGAAASVGLVGAFKKRVGLSDSSSSAASNPRGSEEDTASVASTDERTSEESARTSSKSKDADTDKDKDKEDASKDKEKDVDKLPKGWSKHESRSNPGQFFYAHTSGATSWVVPKDEPEDADADESAASEDEDDGKASTASSASAAASAAAANPTSTPTTQKKKKKGWAFKLPRKLTIVTSAPATSPAASASASTSPIEHDESHHEF